MNCRFKQGDLVVCTLIPPNSGAKKLTGIVLSSTPSPGAFRDTACLDQVHVLEALWDRDVPSWMGKGKIAYVTDSVVELLEEVIGEAG